MSSQEGEAVMKDLNDKANYDRLQKDVDAVKNDILTLADQITDALNSLAGTAQDQARRGYKRARSNVDSVVSDLGRQGGEAFESAQDAASTLTDSLEDAVQHRPLAAVGLALGLGFLIGVTWRR
jgi:ElaB/YqjD/DUF883 family membrane-anchored ribosome-binding protein